MSTNSCPVDPNFGPADRARAEAAIAAVDAAIAHLKQDAATRHSRSATMRQTWKGPYADEFFGTELARMKTQTSQLINELLQLKQQISNAVEQAGSLQRRFNTWQSQQQTTTAPTPPGLPGGR